MLHTFTWHILDNIHICFLQVVKNTQLCIYIWHVSYLLQICCILHDDLFPGYNNKKRYKHSIHFLRRRRDINQNALALERHGLAMGYLACWSSLSTIATAIKVKFIATWLEYGSRGVVQILSLDISEKNTCMLWTHQFYVISNISSTMYKLRSLKI